MTLSADDEITLVEVAVVLIGIVITWAVYRRKRPEHDPTMSEPAPGQRTEPGPADEDRREVR